MGINYSSIVEVISDDVGFVGVRFFDSDGELRGRVYIYKTVLKDLAEGDHVVVRVNEKPKVVQVVEIDVVPEGDHISYKWVVCKVDYTQWDAAIKAEAEIIKQVRKIERRAQREQILSAIGASEEDMQKLTFKIEK